MGAREPHPNGSDHLQNVRPDSTSEDLLRRLQVVTDVALAHLSLEQLERDLLGRVREILVGDIAMLLLLSPDAQTIIARATSDIATGFQDQTQRDIQIPVGQGIAGQIAAQGRALVFDDLSQFEVLNPLLRESRVRSLVGAPLLSENRVIGVIYVGTTQLHQFSSEDAQLLQLAADRFAVAMERARLYEAMREQEQRKSAILEAALDCIILMDHNGNITEFNPAAERTFGYSRDQAIGQPLADLIIPPALRELHWQGIKRYYESGQGAVVNRRVEITGMRADGTEFPVELTVIPMQINGHPFFTGYLRDITERKQAETEREQLLMREQTARAEAEAANLAKDEFLATLSHELRTPLTPMLGWTKLLLTQKLDQEETADALHAVLRSAQTQIRLVEDLLDVSRIITGKLELQLQKTEFAPIMHDVLKMLQEELQDKNLTFQTEFTSESTAVWGDPYRLQQVVWNLLSNALKFTPEGGHITARLQQVDSLLQLQISDSGQGIEDRFLPYVFDRLRQADSSSTRLHGGLGLGLAIVRYLVEHHGGKVRAESGGPGQGATFTVELPLLTSS